jgi:uncharacterized protein YwgA
MQKLFYLVNTKIENNNGYPISIKYYLYKYGTFSKDLAEEISLLVDNNYLIEEEWSDTANENYKTWKYKLNSDDDFTTKQLQGIDAYKMFGMDLSADVNALNRYNSKDLELASTYVYLKPRQECNLLAKLKELKGHIFDDDRLKKAEEISKIVGKQN